MKNKIISFLIFVIGTELIGALSGLLSGGFTAEYGGLIKPPFSPPGEVFGIVWPILYALMGISLFLIWDSDASAAEKKDAYFLYGLQLALNFLWSIVYFGLGLYWAAAVVLAALIVSIVFMIRKFREIVPAAAYLNIPYLIWTVYALYLNIGTAVLN